MSDASALLQELGFSDYEARAYVALLQRSPLNGYELAKLSGVPRPNIYPVLQKLEERSVVVRLETSAGARYAPVPPTELTRRLGTRFKGILDAAAQSLEALATQAERDYVWNLEGYTAVIEHAQALVDTAQCDLLIAVWQPESHMLTDAVLQAVVRGVEINTLCLQHCSEECGDCRGRLYRYQIAANRETRWIIVVQDGTEMLMGDIGDDCASAVRTRQPHLLQIASWYIRHSIALAAILNDLDGELRKLLKPETQVLLQHLGPDGQGWLEYMLNLAQK